MPYEGEQEMKIYTGTGDRGKTSLFSGERVSKSHLRIEAYGDVDELNAILGALAVNLSEDNRELMEEIHGIQSDLFHVGAWLATSPGSTSATTLDAVTEEFSKPLELAVDRMEGELPSLTGFILPGGHITAAWAHVARTVCRRVERHVVRLENESNDAEAGSKFRGVVVYLNRLSDYLFVLARFCNMRQGLQDTPWMK